MWGHIVRGVDKGMGVVSDHGEGRRGLFEKGLTLYNQADIIN